MGSVSDTGMESSAGAAAEASAAICKGCSCATASDAPAESCPALVAFVRDTSSGPSDAGEISWATPVADSAGCADVSNLVTKFFLASFKFGYICLKFEYRGLWLFPLPAPVFLCRHRVPQYGVPLKPNQ